uniref:hypothetical protein n=1 Tax=Milkweed yellows phytoplasma TaxID=208434 RepID=UPI0003625BEF|nr:hypothetical protein [Milkweed yellows phytoplasma]
MNFFKKYWIIIIGLFKGINETKQEPKSLSNYHKEVDNEQKLNQPLRNKREIETPKSKIKITKEKFDIIKNYILSENENEVLTLNDLSQEEKNKIEKFRNSQKQTLEFRKKDQQNIDEKKQECNGYTSQINEIINQIQQLQKQLQQKEEALANKEKDIKDKKEEEKIASPDDKIRLKTEISKLQDEIIELVGQIGEMKVQIGHLKSRQTMCEGILSDAIKLRNVLQHNYDKSLEQNKKSALSSLNSLYEITSAEG